MSENNMIMIEIPFCTVKEKVIHPIQIKYNLFA